MAMAASVPSRQGVELKRQIGLYAATAITVGNIIGSGIFRSPHSVAQHLQSFPVVIFAWVLGGILSICGSLALTELAVATPKTGGLYVFIREGFGDAFAFVFGWANLWVIKPTVIASITSVFALYFCQVLHLPKTAEFMVEGGARHLVPAGARARHDLDPVRVRRLDRFHLRGGRGDRAETRHADRDRVGHVAGDRGLRAHQRRVLP